MDVDSMTESTSGVPDLAEGRNIAAGWKVAAPISLARSLVATSVFKVEHAERGVGFLKIPWHASATTASAGPKRFAARHEAEVATLTYCAEKKLPGVARILTSGKVTDAKQEEFDFIIMELAEENADLCFERLSPPLLWWLASHVMQIGHALAHLHSHGIYHRDLMPQNILLTDSRSRTLITDFGHAYHLGRPSPVNHLPDATPFNQSPPERYYLRPWASRREKLTASDLFQFGSLIFQIMVGPSATVVLFEGHHTKYTTFAKRPDGQEAKVRAIVDRGYKDAVRQLNEAFQKKVPPAFHAQAQVLLNIFKSACHPDLAKRGHAKLTAAGPDQRYEITPYVDDLIALVKVLKKLQF